MDIQSLSNVKKSANHWILLMALSYFCFGVIMLTVVDLHFSLFGVS